MKKLTAYHVVTEKPMYLNQIIIFDENNNSGIYNRVMSKKTIVDDIYKNPNNYKIEDLDHHTKVAIRELALEEVRIKSFKNYPSRLHSLYVSDSLDNANSWVKYFISINRNVFQIVKLEIEGNIFIGDAHNCFDGTIDLSKNLELANHYWKNLPNNKNLPPLYETIVDGRIKVIEIIKTFNK